MTRSDPARPWRVLNAVALMLIVGAGLGLRLWNLTFGLPDWYHPDEPIKVRQIVRMVEGDLRPDSLYHPTFMLYAAAGMMRVMQAAGWSLNEQTAVRAGRLTVALLGAATVPLTCLAGRALGGPFVGLVAAMLLAVAPLHVVCSHYLKEDVPMTFWAVATFLACLRITRCGGRWSCALGGLLAGVTAGTKYVGLLFVALPWLAYREWTHSVANTAGLSDRRVRASPRHPVSSAHGVQPSNCPRTVWLASAVGFLVVTPYALLDLPRFLLGFGHESGKVFTGMAGIAVSPLAYLWTYHLRYSILPGIGLLPAVLAAWGFVLALRRPDPAPRLLTVIIAVLYTVFESSPYKPPPNADRYVVPMLPFLAILAADALNELRARAPSGRWLARLLVTFAVAIPLADATRITASMNSDTRHRARDWLLQHACGADRILLEGALNVGGALVPSYAPALPGRCQATYTYSLEWEQQRIKEYDVVVVTSFMYDRFLRFDSAPAEARRFYEGFFATHEPAAEFQPTYRSYGFHQPTIRIYRLRGPRPVQP